MEKVNIQPNISNDFQNVSKYFQIISNIKKSNIENINIKNNDTENSEKSIVNDNFVCIYCNTIFQTNSGLYKHKKKCNYKKDLDIKETYENKINEIKIDSVIKEKEIIQKQLEKLEKEKEEIKKEKDKQLEKTEKMLEELKKEKDEEKKKLEEQLLYYRDVAYSKKENDCNMTNLNFINTYYDDAPALEGPKDLHKLFNADKSANPEVYYANLASELGSHHRLNILHKVIAEFIVKDYCKEDKTKQSVWNSDSSRLNYIVRECIQKEKIWIMDKNGQSLLKKVIKPIIEYIKPDLEEATKRILSFSSKPNGITFMDMKDHKALLEIGNNIMNNSLQEDILKELTSYFNINQKLLLKDIKENNKEMGNKKQIKMIKDVDNLEQNFQSKSKKILNNSEHPKIMDEVITPKTKLTNFIKELDLNLDKLRKQEHRLDVNFEIDDEDKEDKYKNIEDKKKELKNQKKEIRTLLTSYEELTTKKEEIIKEEEAISNDTESERELETQRQMQINRTTRKKKDILNKITALEKEISKVCIKL